jgi:DNA-binding NtrC family response regulator
VVESPPEVVASLLRTAGHLALGANNYEAAQGIWTKAAGGFDVVIIDDRTGADAQLIPEILAYKPNIRILLMTSRAQPSQRDGVIVLAKPVSPMRLTEAVDAA